MGTSVSQPSPRNTNWRRVLVCHQHDGISVARVMNEVWRACAKEGLAQQIKSPAIFACYQAVRSSQNPQEAIQAFTRALMESKNNSIVAEFAKRSIPMAFGSKSKGAQWAVSLFSQITNYIVARDAGGFVGEGSRNPTVTSLIEYKSSILKEVQSVMAEEVRVIDSGIQTGGQWESFVDESIAKLKSAS